MSGHSFLGRSRMNGIRAIVRKKGTAALLVLFVFLQLNQVFACGLLGCPSLQDRPAHNQSVTHSCCAEKSDSPGADHPTPSRCCCKNGNALDRIAIPDTLTIEDGAAVVLPASPPALPESNVKVVTPVLGWAATLRPPPLRQWLHEFRI